MAYYTRVNGVTVECKIIAIDWDERIADVSVNGENRKVALYKLVMQTSLFEHLPFDEVADTLRHECL